MIVIVGWLLQLLRCEVVLSVELSCVVLRIIVFSAVCRHNLEGELGVLKRSE